MKKKSCSDFAHVCIRMFGTGSRVKMLLLLWWEAQNNQSLGCLHACPPFLHDYQQSRGLAIRAHKKSLSLKKAEEEEDELAR